MCARMKLHPRKLRRVQPSRVCARLDVIQINTKKDYVHGAFAVGEALHTEYSLLYRVYRAHNAVVIINAGQNYPTGI